MKLVFPVHQQGDTSWYNIRTESFFTVYPAQGRAVIVLTVRMSDHAAPMHVDSCSDAVHTEAIKRILV